MKCKECIYCRGYYSDSWCEKSWCEKSNPNFDIMEEVSCTDFEWLLPESREKQKSKTNIANATVEITARLIDVDLLKEILFTFNYINHKQIINLASLNFKDQDRSETYELEEIDLDALISKIKMVLDDD